MPEDNLLKAIHGPQDINCLLYTSLLPKYRGAAPIQRAVINGERQTGVTIMQMARGMDCLLYTSRCV